MTKVGVRVHHKRLDVVCDAIRVTTLHRPDAVIPVNAGIHFDFRPGAEARDQDGLQLVRSTACPESVERLERRTFGP